MNNQILNDQTTVYYEVRVKGIPVSTKFESPMLAEMEKQKLDPALREIAEVVPVTSSGTQLLLG